MGKSSRNEKYRIGIIISILIIIGYIAVIAVNYLSYSKIIKDDIRNITKLSASNIYSEINNELVKPIFVSLTMANDSFLIQWIGMEEEMDTEDLQRYLGGIEEKYGYSSVFLVSNKTHNYYHYNGINKRIDEENMHDQWYYDFINSGKIYDLDVDLDEVTNEMMVFINCRVESENGELLGVVGVGLSMGEVQEVIGIFEEAYGLEAFLMDKSSVVQAHTNSNLIETYNVKEDERLAKFLPEIIENTSSIESFRYKENGLDGYIMTRYIKDLEWYLVVKKDTSVLRKSFDAQLAKEFIILLIVLFGVVIISRRLIHNHELKLSEAAKTDQLTGLYNRRGFDYRMFDMLKEAMEKEQTFSVFIIDIDNFKAINDSHGHLYGDRVIEQVAKYIAKELGIRNTLARWGGDEFAGFFVGTDVDAREALDVILKGFNSDKRFTDTNITISIGLTRSRSIDTPDTIMGRADTALYTAKENGKNQLSEIN